MSLVPERWSRPLHGIRDIQTIAAVRFRAGGQPRCCKRDEQGPRCTKCATNDSSSGARSRLDAPPSGTGTMELSALSSARCTDGAKFAAVQNDPFHGTLDPVAASAVILTVGSQMGKHTLIPRRPLSPYTQCQTRTAGRKGRSQK